MEQDIILKKKKTSYKNKLETEQNLFIPSDLWTYYILESFSFFS